MNRITLIGVLLLMACGTDTGVQPVGSDTFKIFKQGSTGFVGSDKIKSDVMLEASRFCAATGKSMQVVNVITGQPPYILGNFPKAEVQFKCVAPNELTLNTATGEAPTQTVRGEVAISSNVADAEVTVDGRFVGNAPLSSLKLVPGTHVVEVSAKGFVPWKRDLTIVEGSTTRLVAELEHAHP